VSEIDRALTVGQVAERTGLSTHALRFYEREGLMAGPVRRLGNGHRVYDNFDVRWLGIFTALRASGMPLRQIRRFAELVRAGPGNEPERLALLREHERQVIARIAESQDNLEVIATKVRIYQTHVAEGTAAGIWTPADPEPADARRSRAIPAPAPED
jgi:DNA-binding transcriptional MerR regulator